MADGESHPTRKRRLHNFDLPSLKWGNQLYLRHINCGAEILPSGTDNSLALIAADYASPDPHGASRVSSPAIPFESFRHLPPLMIRDDEGDESIRKKLRVHLRSLTAGILCGKNGQVVEFLGNTPWNLRTRRAACDSPSKISRDEGRKTSPEDSPSLKQDARPKSLRLRGLAPDDFVEVKEKKKEAAKFSISSSKGEIEDDFLAMTGSKPSRRPKKRAKIVQKKLDELFPGLWLSDVTPELYKVTDPSE